MGKGKMQWDPEEPHFGEGRSSRSVGWFHISTIGRLKRALLPWPPTQYSLKHKERSSSSSQTIAPMHSETFIRNHPPNTPRSTVGPTCFLRKEGHSIGVSRSWAAWPVSPGSYLELIMASTPSQQHESSIRTSTNATQETPKHTHLHYT